MKKIHLILLSDQQIPNLLSTLHFKPDVLAMVESSRMKKKKKADYLIEALKIVNNDFNSNSCKPYSIEQVDDIDSVKQVLTKCYEEIGTGQWTVNLTGGNKLLSFSTYDFFKNKTNAKMLYTEVERSNEGIWLHKEKPITYIHQLKIKEFLTSYGYKILTPQKAIDRSKKIAEDNCQLAIEFAKNIDYQPFLKDLKTYRQSLPNVEEARENGAKYPIDIEFKSPIIQKTMEIFAPLKDKLPKKQVKFLTGEWLEIFCYNAIKNISGVTDAAIGLNIEDNEGSKNEFDVVFIRNNSFYFIECKTGLPIKKNPNNESKSFESSIGESMNGILYKIEAIVGSMKALKNNPICAISSSDIYKEGKIKDSIQTRAKSYNCKIWDKNELLNIAQGRKSIEELLNERP